MTTAEPSQQNRGQLPPSSPLVIFYLWHWRFPSSLVKIGLNAEKWLSKYDLPHAKISKTWSLKGDETKRHNNAIVER